MRLEEAARVKAHAKAEAEAKVAKEQRRLQAKTKAAGTAFALLGMDSDGDETESEEEEWKKELLTLSSSLKAAETQAAKEAARAKEAEADEVIRARTKVAAKTTERVAETEVTAETAAEPIWWGSEAWDLAQRCPLPVTVAVYSHKGEHKLHANEDRHFHAVDFETEVLAKHPHLAALHQATFDAAAEGATPAPFNSFFGVYDGHGGSAAAAAAASRLHVLLASDPHRWRQAPDAALRGAFTALEAELRASYDRDGHDKSGTCAIVSLLRGHRLFVASVGDCRAVLIRHCDHAEPFVQLTTDMRATLQSEARRIAAAGAQVSDGRLWGALIPSRTLGDFPWKDRGPGLIATPEAREVEVTPDVKYLVLGSDGLFDVLPNKTISRLVGKMSSSAQKVCNELVKEVKKRPGQDDITLMVIQFRHDATSKVRRRAQN